MIMKACAGGIERQILKYSSVSLVSISMRRTYNSKPDIDNNSEE